MYTYTCLLVDLLVKAGKIIHKPYIDPTGFVLLFFLVCWLKLQLHLCDFTPCFHVHNIPVEHQKDMKHLSKLVGNSLKCFLKNFQHVTWLGGRVQVFFLVTSKPMFLGKSPEGSRFLNDSRILDTKKMNFTHSVRCRSWKVTMIFGQCEGSGCHWHGTWESYDLPVFLGVVPCRCISSRVLPWMGTWILGGKRAQELQLWNIRWWLQLLQNQKASQQGIWQTLGCFGLYRTQWLNIFLFL